jgi:hypothetical protein
MGFVALISRQFWGLYYVIKICVSGGVLVVLTAQGPFDSLSAGFCIWTGRGQWWTVVI